MRLKAVWSGLVLSMYGVRGAEFIEYCVDEGGEVGRWYLWVLILCVDYVVAERYLHVAVFPASSKLHRYCRYLYLTSSAGVSTLYLVLYSSTYIHTYKFRRNSVPPTPRKYGVNYVCTTNRVQQA